jgi:hypothetical protein
MDENPWTNLPDKPPFVLIRDRDEIENFNKKVRNPIHVLRTDQILPEAFVGARDAPVVLLSNNPGHSDDEPRRSSAKYQLRMRKNLRHEKLKYPFVFLDPKLRPVGEWWERKLKSLFRIYTREAIARSLLNVPFFPYASSRFDHSDIVLDSQAYGFGLVRQAMQRGAVIVFMRRDNIWKEKIHELRDYELAFQVKNRQNPTLNPGNLPDGVFEKIVLVIAAAEAKRRGA